MRYVKVFEAEDGSKSGEILSERPQWCFDGGVSVSDEYLIDNANIFPLIEDHFGDDSYLIKSSSEWDYNLDNVTVNYYNVIDNTLPEEIPLSDDYVSKSEDQWIYDEDANTVEIQYDVYTRTDEEISDFIEDHGIEDVDQDWSGYEEKPKSDWLFTGGVIKKTRWEILEDSDQDNYSDIFYKSTITDESEWLITDTTKQQKLTFSERSISDIKISLVERISYYRWEIEIGGYVWNGNSIHTDRESQTKLTSMYTLIKSGAITGDITFKTMDGFIVMSVSDMESMCLGVNTFIQTLYTKESVLIDQINNASTFQGLVDIYDNMSSLMSVSGAIFV